MKLTLDNLREKSEKRFDDLQVEDVTFQHLLRLKKQDRKRVEEITKAIQDDEAEVDQFAMVREALLLASDDKTKARSLVSKMDDGMLLIVFEEWAQATQPGEATS